MSLLGIDVGTTGCKALVFREDGTVLGHAYAEYDLPPSSTDQAEMDPTHVWEQVRRCIAQAVSRSGRRDPVRALSVSSLGESTVGICGDRRIVGQSMLMNDPRGEEYIPALRSQISNRELFDINGNVLGNHYSLTKLMWRRDHMPEQYRSTRWFLHYSGFVCHMLGAEPAVDYSLANRSLLFDIHSRTWSPHLCALADIDPVRLPPPVASGVVIGKVLPGIAEELGLPSATLITAGAHDQTANAVGSGVTEPGCAMYGMGTYACIVPVFTAPPPSDAMIALGLNVEHHAVSNRYVCFVYNPGRSIVRWYRDTFASPEQDYAALMDELPSSPSTVLVLPHFTQTGPPEFVADSAGVIAGLHLSTSRGEILRGILESITFSLRHCVDGLPGAGIHIREYRVVGGGSQSPTWVQLSCDILGVPFVRPAVSEAGALGAAVMAGTGAGIFANMTEGARAMVHEGRRFEPNRGLHDRYEQRYRLYSELHPALAGLLRKV